MTQDNTAVLGCMLCILSHIGLPAIITSGKLKGSPRFARNALCLIANCLINSHRAPRKVPREAEGGTCFLDAHVVVGPGISSIAKTILATGAGPVLHVPICSFVVDVLAEI